MIKHIVQTVWSTFQINLNTFMLNVILMVFETGGTLGQITLLDGGVAEVLSWKKSGAVP